MVVRVLVPMDASEMAAAALRYAFDVHADAEITVLHVVGEPSPMMGKAAGLILEDDVEQAAEEHAADVLDRATELAAEHDHPIETEVGYGSPSRVIVDRAEDYDVVVIGSHGGSVVDRLFVGNVAEKVFHRSPVPVTAVR